MARKSKGRFNMRGHSISGIKGFKSTALEDGRAASSAFQMQSPLNKFKADEDEIDVETDKSQEDILEEERLRLEKEEKERLEKEKTEEKSTATTYDPNADKYEHGMKWDEIEESTYDPYKAVSMDQYGNKIEGAMTEFSKLEWKDGKLVRKGGEEEEDKSKSEEMDDQINKDQTELPDATTEEYDPTFGGTDTPINDDEYKMEFIKNLDKDLTVPEIKDNTPDFSNPEEFESVNDLVAERDLWREKNPDKRFPGQDEINKRLKENPNKWGKSKSKSKSKPKSKPELHTDAQKDFHDKMIKQGKTWDPITGSYS